MVIVTKDKHKVAVGDSIVYDQTFEWMLIKSIDPTQWAECVNGKGERMMLNGLRMFGKVRPLGKGFLEVKE